MDAMMFLGFVTIVLTGGALMAFALECLSTEHRGERAARQRRVEAEPAIQSAATLPAFFATLQTRERPVTDPKFDDALIALLENHVRAEQAMVSRFVNLPSVDSLYRRAQSPPTMN